MAFTIEYFSEKQLKYSQSVSKNIGKRIVVVGSCDNFDDTGYVDEASVIDTSAYDYKRLNIGNLDAIKGLIGNNNDLYDSYKSIINAGAFEASIIKVPYTRASNTAEVVSDREQFKRNLVSTVSALLEKDDFDICVLTSISIEEDKDCILEMINQSSGKNILKLILINATRPSSETIWSDTVTQNVTSLTNSRKDMIKNICVVTNNAEFYDKSFSIKPANVDFDKIHVASYVAGLLTASSYKHPSMSTTVFNNIAQSIPDSRVSYFRNNSVRGIILSNFNTLGGSLDSKSSISSAINVYRASVISSTLSESLKPIIGTPISVDSQYGTSLKVQEIITSVLDKFVALEIITKYKFTFSVDQLKMTGTAVIDLVMAYDLESVTVRGTIGV